MKRAIVIGNAFSSSDGGGIRYASAIAAALSDLKFDVTYQPGFNKNLALPETIHQRQSIQIEHEDHRLGLPIMSRIQRALNQRSRYHLLFRQSSQIPDFTFNRNAYLFCDFPQPGLNFTKEMLLKTYPTIIANSTFTASWITHFWHRKAEVLYPLVDEIKPGKKEHIILSVGRFAKGGRTKNHLEMIATFKRLHQSSNLDWTLHLAGYVQDLDYLEEVKLAASGLPIIFHLSPNRDEINSLFGKAAIYWHFCGINANPFNEPQRMEHFGISTAEAMSAGCVPIVINQGGQPEVTGNKAGALFNTMDEALTFTLRFIEDENLRVQHGSIAIQQSKLFQWDAFFTQFKRITGLQ